MIKSDLKDAIMSTSELVDWFIHYYESLDEEGKQSLWKKWDMDNYDPKEMEPSVFKKRLEQQTLRMEQEMPGIINKLDEEFEWDLMTPWWKKVLVRAGVRRR